MCLFLGEAAGRSGGQPRVEGSPLVVGLTTIRTYRQKVIVMRRSGDDRFKKYEKWCDPLTIVRQSDCKIYEELRVCVAGRLWRR